MTFSRAEMLINKHIDILNHLIEGESEGRENAKNEFDGDGTLSLGCLQFKWKTFREKAIKYGVFNGLFLDNADWQNRWADCWSQKLVAATMLENEQTPLCHWRVTSRDIRNYKCPGE